MEEVEFVDHRHHLPHDVIFSIFFRLPVKFLVRLESVCKQWRSFIKDSNFISLYVKYQCKHNACMSILVCDSGYDRKLYSINIKGLTATTCRLNDFNVVTKTSEISYCNGLLSYYSFKSSLVVVHNPSTGKEWLVLPRLEHKGSTPRGFGFGFDSSVNEYKVVLFGPSKCEVFTIGTSSWRPTKNRPILNYEDDKDYYMAPVFVNGALYWLSAKDIISFDLKSEEFGVIPFPNGVSGEECYWRLCLSNYYLLELKEQLCMVCPGNVVADSKVVDLWMLKGWKNNVWVKEDSFVLPPNWSSSYTLSTTPEGEIFVAGCKDISFSRFYIHSYDPQSRMTRTIEFVGKDFPYFRIINHVENPFRLIRSM